MRLVIGSDHGGFEAKGKLLKFLQGLGHEVADFGCYSTEAVDYPDIAQLVAEAVVRGEYEKGVLLDGFGGAVVRDAPSRPLAPARRKALIVAFGRLGALRTLRDPAG